MMVVFKTNTQVGTLGALTDVDLSTNLPADKQALVYDATAQKWKPGTVSSGSGSTTKSYTYLRLSASAIGSGGSVPVIAQIIFKDASGNVIPTTGGASFSSSDYSADFQSAYAFDGSAPGTRRGWIAANNVPQSIGYHFASSVLPASITIVPGNGGDTVDCPTAFTVEGSPDGSTYTTLTTQSGIAWAAGQSQTFTLAAAAKGTLNPPKPAQFTDYSVYGRGSTNAAPALLSTFYGMSMQDTSGDNQGFKTALRAIPYTPTAGKTFGFQANINYLYGALGASGEQYGSLGICLADAAGNVQLWGLNSGGSGREGQGFASYNSNGSWSDGDYAVGGAADGDFFIMLTNGIYVLLFRGISPVSFNTAKTYKLSDHGVGTPTRYGFFVHHYSKGSPVNDQLLIGACTSDEFPAG